MVKEGEGVKEWKGEAVKEGKGEGVESKEGGWGERGKEERREYLSSRVWTSKDSLLHVCTCTYELYKC